MAKRRRRRRRRRRLPAWVYPAVQERRFARALRQVVAAPLAAAIREIILPELPSLVAQAEAERQGKRIDSWETDLADLQKMLEIDLEDAGDNAGRAAMSIAPDLGKQNRAQYRKIMGEGLGVVPFRDEPWFPSAMQDFARRNSDLIVSVARDEARKIEGIVTTGLNTGARVESIQKDILRRVTVTESRANLIARDQVAKFNSLVTEKRQTALGISRYIWRTSLDERVRGRPGGLYANNVPRHWNLEGMMCRWDDATVYSEDEGATWKKRATIKAVELHPGMDFQCRCTPEPVIDDILEPEEPEPEPTPPPTPEATTKSKKRERKAPKPKGEPRRRIDLATLPANEQDAEIDRRMKRARAKLDKAAQQVNQLWDELRETIAQTEMATRALRELKPDATDFIKRKYEREQLDSIRKRGDIYRKISRIKNKSIGNFVSKEFAAFEKSRVHVGDISRGFGSRTRRSWSNKWAKQFEKMLDKRAVDDAGSFINVMLDALPPGRRRAFEDRGVIYLPSRPARRQFMHEVGHVIEYRSEKVRRASVEFLAKRTKGETAESLSKLTGKNYEEWEVAKKDRFRDPYTGKIYPDDTEGGKSATEILSMGIEQFMEDPQGFYDSDPEFFRFVAKVLGGAI